LVIIPKWENSGDTPTKNMLNYVSWGLFVKDIPAGFDFPDQGDEERIPILIPPHAIIYSGSLEFNKAQIDKVISGEKRLFLWGYAEYNDVFAGTNRHRTEFCNEVVISHVSENELALRFPLYRKHNGADQECMKQIQTTVNLLV
jgi:hypothetical protein